MAFLTNDTLKEIADVANNIVYDLKGDFEGHLSDRDKLEFERTPERFRGYMESLLCRHTTEAPVLTTFPTTNDEMILIEPFDFYSLCPHHLALVLGKAYVGYIPHKKVLGLSKVPRLVRWLAGDIIKQEDLVVEIADFLEDALFERVPSGTTSGHGVAVVLRAVHTCMLVRGIRVNSDCRVQTSKMTGCFLDPTKKARDEFFSLIRRGE